MTDFNQPISGNDLARFSGPNTFMRLPQADTLAGLDVAVLGIPMDIGTVVALWYAVRAETDPQRKRNDPALQHGQFRSSVRQLADSGYR